MKKIIAMLLVLATHSYNVCAKADELVREFAGLRLDVYRGYTIIGGVIKIVDGKEMLANPPGYRRIITAYLTNCGTSVRLHNP